MSTYELEKLDHDPIKDLEENVLHLHEELAGCYRIPSTPFTLCWELNAGKFEICLKLGPVRLACAMVELSNPCAVLEANAGCAKVSVEVCLRNNCLTYDARACTRPFPCQGDWNCVRARGNIICFG